MIKNDRQYAIVKSHAARLRELTEKIAQDDSRADSDMGRFELQTVNGELQQLTADLSEYEALKSGKSAIGLAETIDDLPRLLIRARIAAGLQQRDLAAKLNLKEQQIQRYEATDYAGASLSRLRQIAGILNVQLTPRITALQDSELASFIQRLVGAGLHPEVVAKKLASRGSGGAPDVLALVSAVARIFGWTVDALRGAGDLQMDRAVLSAASFKLPKTVDEKKLSAYGAYAYYLASLAAQATSHMVTSDTPSDSKAIRSALLQRGGIRFKVLLDLLWDYGVVILPLDDAGTFHGAVWKFSGKPVIVLKQKNRKSGRWLFDLLHELWHVIANAGKVDAAVMDVKDVLMEHSLSAEEKKANRFAMNILLDHRPDQLAEECVHLAGNRIERLSHTTPIVAKRAGVPVSALAMHLAHLIDEDFKGRHNWWGAATNLSREDEDHWLIARDTFLQRADFSHLALIDRDILSRALQDAA